MVSPKSPPRHRRQKSRSTRRVATPQPWDPVTSHLSSFEVIRYRSIGGLSIPQFTKANLYTGLNGVGKTALLEAMWLFNGRNDSSLLWNSKILRSPDPVVDPVSALSKDYIQFNGVEASRLCRHKITYERIFNRADLAILHQSETGSNPPFVGRIVTEINDRKYRKPEVLHATPVGLVACRIDPSTAHEASVIIDKAQNIEISRDRILRYSELVRAGQKPVIGEAMKIVIEDYKDVAHSSPKCIGSG